MLLAAPACVRVYHPLRGLADPVVVDTTRPNLDDARISVHCIPGGMLSVGQANQLCRKVQTLFENQGAEVSTVTDAYRRPDDPFAAPDAAGDDDDDPGDEEDEEDDRRTELTLEIRAEQVHRDDHALSWVAWTLTATLAPGVTERTFAQEVTVRDPDGFLLATRTLEGRTVRRSGAGVWLGNKLADWWWREDDDKLTAENMDRDLSHDLYGHMSQLVFDAKLKQQVLERDVVRRR